MISAAMVSRTLRSSAIITTNSTMIPVAVVIMMIVITIMSRATIVAMNTLVLLLGVFPHRLWGLKFVCRSEEAEDSSFDSVPTPQASDLSSTAARFQPVCVYIYIYI